MDRETEKPRGKRQNQGRAKNASTKHDQGIVLRWHVQGGDPKKKRPGQREGRAFFLAFNPIEGWSVGGYLGAGEREEEIIPFLRWIREMIDVDPEYITIDFDDAWESSVKIVFPDATIIICTFHAVQLLTRGMLKEFNRLQKENNTVFIKECGLARKASIAIDKGKFLASNFHFSQQFCATWLAFYQKISAFDEVNTALSFTKLLSTIRGKMKTWHPEAAALFEQKIMAKLPKQGITPKSMKYIKNELKQKWRAVLREFRDDRKKKMHEFAEAKYLLLKKPKNMAGWETEHLDTFLRNNTWAIPYRNTILQFYTLIDDPPSESPALDFLDTLVRPDSHDMLKSAVNTLKEKKDYIFNFVKAWKMHPKWKNIRAFKTNPEPKMKGIKNVSRVQYGFRSDESTRYKLEKYLNCPVMISQTVLNENYRDMTLN
jgi:hypothetical protein